MIRALSWQLPGLELSFSTRAAGNLRLRAGRERWLAEVAPNLRVALPEQVHGARIVHAADQDGLQRADGVLSREPDQGVGVFGADCPGVVCRAGTIVAAAHCGWRGCAAGIVPALLAAVAAEDVPPLAQWQVFIGPGICGNCYEVDGPVLGARLWPETALQHHRPGYARLDLVAVITTDLQSAGVENIEVSGLCTACDHRLHSYRQQGPGGTQLLLARRR